MHLSDPKLTKIIAMASKLEFLRDAFISLFPFERGYVRYSATLNKAKVLTFVRSTSELFENGKQ